MALLPLRILDSALRAILLRYQHSKSDWITWQLRQIWQIWRGGPADRYDLGGLDAQYGDIQGRTQIQHRYFLRSVLEPMIEAAMEKLSTSRAPQRTSTERPVTIVTWPIVNRPQGGITHACGCNLSVFHQALSMRIGDYRRLGDIKSSSQQTREPTYLALHKAESVLGEEVFIFALEYERLDGSGYEFGFLVPPREIGGFRLLA
jgi:hypothetical protein